MAEKTDLITGLPLTDREDEYIRQAVEGLLLERGYPPESVQVDARRMLHLFTEPTAVRADLLVLAGHRPGLLLRCPRGSLVTREREAIAAARLIADPWPPLAVVCNGEDVELLQVATGKVLAQGLGAIPCFDDLKALVESYPPHHPSESELQRAARVYEAFATLQCPSQCIS